MNKLGQLKKKVKLTDAKEELTREKDVQGIWKERKRHYDIVDTVFAMLIGFIMIMFLMIGLASAWKDSIEEKYEKQFNIADAQYTKLDIKFNDLDTGKEVYNKLNKSCKQFVSKENSGDTDWVSNGYTKSNGKYIDTKKQTGSEKEETDSGKQESLDEMNETGPIYLNDMLVMRYISDSGEMKVAAAKINESTGEIKTSTLNDLELTTKEKGEVNDWKSKGSKNTKITGTITEDTYLQDVMSIFVSLVTQKNIDYILKREALQFFTEDGYNSMIKNPNRLLVDKNSLEVKYIVAGKSSLENKNKDRVLLQMVVGKDSYVNVVIKLNKNNKIFDIDIV